MFDPSGAAFRPVSAIDVGYSEVISDHGMMDMPANDAVDTAPPRLGGECVLVLSDELDRVLDFQLRPFGQGPIGQPERTPDRVEIGVEPDRQIVGVVAQKREPAGVANDDVEKVAVDDQIALAARAHVDGILEHLDAAEMRAVIVAQELVMITWNVKQ